jgi:hypothetical protein
MKLDTEGSSLTSTEVPKVPEALEDCFRQSVQWQKNNTVDLENCEQSEVIFEVKMELSR